LFSFGAWAQGPHADSGAQWDDRHMRSNFANHLRAAPRPPLRIAEPGAAGADAAAPTHVQETILSISPHEWEPGGPRGGSSPSRSSSSSFSASDAGAWRSAGVRGSSPSVGGRSSSASLGVRHER
jgi:hypothetical protein